MKTEEYGKYLSEAYDALNTDVDYEAWAQFYLSCAEKYLKNRLTHVCEMACGTGNLAIALAKRGLRVTAFDLSDTMLTLADKKAHDAGAKNIRLTRQDMRDFRVYSPAELAVCMMDGVNCLLSPEDISAAFESAYRALSDGGMFVFDLNSRHKFETVYGENAYILEDEGVTLAWQNFYNPRTKKCDMELSFFLEQPDGRYARYDERVRERMYPVKTVEKLLAGAGFDVFARVSDFDFTPADERTCDRIFFVCGKKTDAAED